MIDQGKTLRLSGIQSPELTSKIPVERAAALAAMINLGKLCPPGSTILIHTLYDKREKYGRFFGWVYRTPEDFAMSLRDKVTVDGVPTLSVNRMQVLAGHAIAWDGTNPAKPETVLSIDLGGVR
jgi:endonuclease YncB( thermonuclease family)